MTDISAVFGSEVFNDTVMRQKLPKDTYEQLQRTIKDKKHLDLGLANIVAHAMKEWAIEKGATHFTHWFQPMTGFTAEKHESFISPVTGGKVIMEFSGKELIRGEPDASSFPSGGLRATFEARGYTAWDATSYAFIKDGTLCIPTAFCSYGGHALDKKTPLLRSMQALSKQAVRVLKLFGNEYVHYVESTVGAEQEYFLIDRGVYEKRKDLIYTGRTLFGAKPPKGQELDDHYFGAIKPRVLAYMQELDLELWKMGITSKTEHNEVAPGQHELAPIYGTCNIAADHNQLTMELMQKIAKKHDMVCLLHEKPFAGVNGSGKHNNWSLTTDTGVNLFNPGETPEQNAQFLLFFCAVIKAVDEYQDLLRISVASAGNDHRLGASEAPPAIISVFVGTELAEILSCLENDQPYPGREKEQLRVGVHTLPRIPRDTTDRNRTSPFAFTGNKFEFRMPGSSSSISDPIVAINTSVADALKSFADELENTDDFEDALHNLIRKTISDHTRIIFNGNGYEDAWIKEAERRGLSNLKTTPEAVSRLLDEKIIRLFSEHKVYSLEELNAHYEIRLENYCKIIRIEALTLLNMVNKDVMPAVSAFLKELGKSLLLRRETGLDLCASYEEALIREQTELLNRLCTEASSLSAAIEEENTKCCITDRAFFCKDEIVTLMSSIRQIVDKLEEKTRSDFWPYPTYGAILFSVK